MVLAKGIDDVRQRDVFPLPFLEESWAVSRHAASRAKSCLSYQVSHCERWTNDGLCALNDIMGLGHRKASSAPAPACALAATEHIASAYAALGPRPSDLPDDAGCYHDILSSSTCYSSDRNDVVPFDMDKVSWPPLGAKQIPLLDNLESADSDRLRNWEQTLLRDIPSTEPAPRVHNDPVLFKDPRTYARFLERLFDCGMLRFDKANGRAASLGAFFVRKSNGQLRLIFDTRALNLLFRDPDTVALPTAAALSSIEIEPGEEAFLSSADLSCAFYQMAVPSDLASLFTLQPIRAGYLRPSIAHHFKWDEEVMPTLTILPMGWSWSLYFCQRLVETSALANSNGRLVRDKCPGTVLDKSAPSAGVGYVDNFGAVSIRRASADTCCQRMIEDFSSLGFIVHEEKHASSSAEFVGLELAHNRLSIKRRRLWRLRGALTHVVSQGYLAGNVLEVLVGHISWAMLI